METLKASFEDVADWCEKHLEDQHGREIGMTFGAMLRAYGATHTPHLFIFNSSRKLAYTGKIDDNWENPEAVTKNYLRNALDDILVGLDPRLPETHAIGCTIKWKK